MTWFFPIFAAIFAAVAGASFAVDDHVGALIFSFLAGYTTSYARRVWSSKEKQIQKKEVK